MKTLYKETPTDSLLALQNKVLAMLGHLLSNLKITSV